MNVQSFPRPPLLERTSRHLQIRYKGEVLADTTEAYWVLETHHPPSKFESLAAHASIVSLASSLLTFHGKRIPTTEEMEREKNYSRRLYRRSKMDIHTRYQN